MSTAAPVTSAKAAGEPVDSPLRMYVMKRDGRKEKVLFDKITSRVMKLAYGLNTQFVDPVSVKVKAPLFFPIVLLFLSFQAIRSFSTVGHGT